MLDSKKKLSNLERMEAALRAFSAFKEWPDLAMRRLLASSRLVWHARGDVVATASDSPDVFVILEGHAMQRVSSASSGDRSLLGAGLRGPGMILGWNFIAAAAEKGDLDLIASNDVVAIHMPWRDLLELLDEDPARWKDFGRLMLRQERALIDLSVGLIVGELPRRLAITLEHLAGLYGVQARETGSVRLNISQKDLAAVLQVNRRSVNRELQSLALGGVLDLQYNAIEILDPVALEEISRGATE